MKLHKHRGTEQTSAEKSQKAGEKMIKWFREKKEREA